MNTGVLQIRVVPEGSVRPIFLKYMRFDPMSEAFHRVNASNKDA
jgi:hypothetical protein